MSKFRILLARKSGIGKSSLIRCIFNLDSDKIDVAHGRVGTADINREYTSLANPRFILHDSKGFEPGDDGTWRIVEKFLKERQELDLPNKIHALWFCIETPLPGSRLLQRDEKLLKLAKKFKIPLIVVFLKYDHLVAHSHKNNKSKSKEENYDDAKKKASQLFDDKVDEPKKDLGSNSLSCESVDTNIR
ncbi:hypothetical protein BYT27DRAFT_6334268 [Phlegmacium glaucopus]|nr:hypothetical protein BYT27DRAFT_6334268 [Phlegmacium glaucopus]